MALLEISDFASGAVDLPKELKALHCATTTTETTIRSHIMVNGKKNNGKGRPVPRTEDRVRNEKMQIYTTGMYSMHKQGEEIFCGKFKQQDSCSRPEIMTGL